jgi:platelet-activating factor acetylhydrolase IB subunit alpha
MKADFLKHRFKTEEKMTALKELGSEGINGIANYLQTFILTCSRDKLIKLFIAHSGELLFTFVGHDNWVKDLALHPKGKYLYSVSDDKSLRVWDLMYGKEKKRVEAHENFISSIRFQAKYGMIATGGVDAVVKLWSLK